MKPSILNPHAKNERSSPPEVVVQRMEATQYRQRASLGMLLVLSYRFFCPWLPRPRARPRGEQSHRDGGAFGRRRGITSTNVTSVTVPANHTVIDAGLTVGTVWSEDGSNGTQFAHDTRTGFSGGLHEGRKDCSEVAD